MATLLGRTAVFLVPLLVGCAPHYTAPPPLPPPPPPLPAAIEAPPDPPQAEAAPPQSARENEESEPAPAVSPQVPVARGAGSGGPLPALPSQAPQYAPAEAPPPSTWVEPHARGQWVYLPERGWIWVPGGATASAVEGVPYTYLYTPADGWNWYVSPWGWGTYRYGGWVRHPYRPSAWDGHWVARPSVVVHLGGRRHR